MLLLLKIRKGELGSIYVLGLSKSWSLLIQVICIGGAPLCGTAITFPKGNKTSGGATGNRDGRTTHRQEIRSTESIEFNQWEEKCFSICFMLDGTAKCL